MIKAVWWEIHSMLLPKDVIIKRNVFHNNRQMHISNYLLKQVFTFFMVYLLLFVLSTVIVLVFCNDFQTAYSIVAASIGNTGLGPSYISTSMPVVVKVVLIFDFLAGRIGIWPVLLPFIYLINRFGYG